jgi:hypothetical protein
MRLYRDIQQDGTCRRLARTGVIRPSILPAVGRSHARSAVAAPIGRSSRNREALSLRSGLDIAFSGPFVYTGRSPPPARYTVPWPSGFARCATPRQAADSGLLEDRGEARRAKTGHVRTRWLPLRSALLPPFRRPVSASRRLPARLSCIALATQRLVTLARRGNNLLDRITLWTFASKLATVHHVVGQPGPLA